MRTITPAVLQLRPPWDVQFGANLVVASHPGLGARLEYHECLQPVPRLGEVIERVRRADREFRVQEVGEPERIVTSEGELGARVVLRGARGPAAARRFIGLVHAGERATLLDVLALEPRHFAVVEALSLELAREQRFEQTARPRQFWYVPPPGWHGLPSASVATWLAPAFPSVRAIIVVPPAPRADDPAAMLAAIREAWAAGIAVDERTQEPLRAACGIEGLYERIRGRRGDEVVHRELAGFVLGSRVYHARLEAAAGAGLADLQRTFLAVARSIEPVPPSIPSSSRIELFEHWVT